MREYVVMINELPHTVQLSEEDAARYGDAARPVESKRAEPKPNKARKPRNKADGSRTAG